MFVIVLQRTCLLLYTKNMLVIVYKEHVVHIQYIRRTKIQKLLFFFFFPSFVVFVVFCVAYDCYLLCK